MNQDRFSNKLPTEILGRRDAENKVTIEVPGRRSRSQCRGGTARPWEPHCTRIAKGAWMDAKYKSTLTWG